MYNTTKSYILRRCSRIQAKFPELWKHYLYQSFFATLVVFIILLVLSLQNAVVIASIGASAFIVFTMPKNITARPRRVIGGHMVGMLCGSVCALIPHTSTLTTALVLSLAVGISIFLMVAFDFEHPPAAGTALGTAITGFSPDVIIALLTSVLILSLAHHFSKRFLRDLV